MPRSVWVRIRDIRDGTSNTLLMGEAGVVNGPVYPKAWFVAYGDGFSRTVLTTAFKINDYNTVPSCGHQWNIGGRGGFGSAHEGGAFFLIADGQVRFLSENINQATYNALATRANNEIIDDEDY